MALKAKQIKPVSALIFYLFCLFIVIGLVILGLYILVETDDSTFAWKIILFFGSMLPLLIYLLINYKLDILNSDETGKSATETFCWLVLFIGFVVESVFFYNEAKIASVIGILLFGGGAVSLAILLVKANRERVTYGYINESGSIFVGRKTNPDGKIIEQWVSASELDSAAKVLTEVTGLEVRGDFSDKHYYSGIRYVFIPGDHYAFGSRIETLHSIRKKIVPGYVSFIGVENYGMGEKGAGIDIVVAPGESQLDIMWAAGVDDYFTTQLKSWDSKYGIDLLQINYSFMHFNFLRLPTDLKLLVNEIRRFCPDCFQDSGPELVADLKKYEVDLVKSREVILGWC